MSTQSISQLDLQEVKSKADSALKCISKSKILNSEFGFEFKYNKYDIFKMGYLYGLLNRDINCSILLNSSKVLEKTNRIITKYN